jgi:hypothetical protein
MEEPILIKFGIYGKYYTNIGILNISDYEPLHTQRLITAKTASINGFWDVTPCSIVPS